MTDQPQSDLRTNVDNLERQFTAVDNRVISLSRDVTGIMTAVDKIGSQVGELTRVVTTMQAASAVAPRFDIGRALTVIGTTVVIFAAVTSGITYIASSVSAPAILENKLRAEFLQARLDNGWYKHSGLSQMQIRSPGGTVSPQP